MGELGGIIALYFNGATCTFHELPDSSDKEAMKEVYAYLDSCNNKKSKLFLLFSKIKNKLK